MQVFNDRYPTLYPSAYLDYQDFLVEHEQEAAIESRQGEENLVARKRYNLHTVIEGILRVFEW